MKWMPHASLGFLAWCLVALPAKGSTPAWANNVPPEELQRQALQHEKAGAWLAAAELYGELAKRDVGRMGEWQAKQVVCRKQDRICRRYYSPHVRQHLLSHRLQDLLNLYEEVLAKLHHHALVESSPGLYFRKGLSNFHLAVRNPAYCAVLFPSGIREDLLRDYLQGLWPQVMNVDILQRKQALRELRSFALTLEQDLGANPSAVVLEFVYASAESVDEYTEYLPPELVQLMERAERPDVANVGLGFFVLQGQLWISTVQAASPASQAGLSPHDLILTIDGIPTQAMTVEEAEWRLLGLEGTSVVLEVADKVGEPSRQVKLTRQKTMTSSVNFRMLDDQQGLGLIALGWFQESTPIEFDEAYLKLQGKGLRGLVLDLRGNPGGLLQAGLQTAERFVPDGVLATTRGRTPGASAVHRANGNFRVSVPVVVLIDQETASAAEILAAALRDHRRGVLIGQKSFGKGCTQSLFPLKPGLGALRITTATWHTPLDDNVGDKGLLPDLPITERDDIASTDETALDVTKRQLSAAQQKLRQLLAGPN